MGWLFTWLLRLQWVAWRKEVEGLERLDRRLARGERTLVAFWHGKYLPLFTLLLFGSVERTLPEEDIRSLSREKE